MIVDHLRELWLVALGSSCDSLRTQAPIVTKKAPTLPYEACECRPKKEAGRKVVTHRLDYFQDKWTLETQRQEIVRRPPPKQANVTQETVLVDDDAPTPTRDVPAVKEGLISRWVTTEAKNIDLAKQVQEAKKALSTAQAESAAEADKNNKLKALNRVSSSNVQRAGEGEQL
jgi:hypothetical protein